MERFFKRKLSSISSNNRGSSSSKESELDDILANLHADPGLRPRILDYDPNFRDEIRRAYLQRGPCQPKDQDFPQSNLSGYVRRFNKSWFDEFDWLEYSTVKDAAFCLYCCLFKSNFEQVSNDAFTGAGFRNWKKKEKLRNHVGSVGSFHNKARQCCQDLMNREQHIVIKQTNEARILLNAALDCTRFLLRQGLSFHGNDEKDSSSNKGNYVELMYFLADHDEKVKVAMFDNALENLKLVTHSIQVDLVYACAIETIEAITSDMNGAFFSLMVDESCDVSIKEQMAVVFRYVDKRGQVIKRFVGVQHVADVTSRSLKEAIDQLFSTTKLSISKLRGQSYNGASNMKGEFNGLKAKILRENPYAFYVHCFAHKLQLALVAVAKTNVDIATFFTSANSLVNIVGAACKRRDALREQLQKDLVESLENDWLLTGQGLNQETSLKRADDTRWASHYGTLIIIIAMFKSVVKVLELIVDDGSPDNIGEANRSLKEIQSFEFVFHLFLMRSILGVTNVLSLYLQRKDQDIVGAMSLVKACKQALQYMRDNEFDLLLDQVSSFCTTHDIEVPTMDDPFVARGKSQRRSPKMTNLHHYRVDLFFQVIDMQLLELNNRFDEVNTELLICLACLSPDDSFLAFDQQKLVRFAQFYPQEFPTKSLLKLEDQLGLYIQDVGLDSDFSNLKGIGSLAKKMVETGKNRIYTHVYLLITLGLVLPVVPATVERTFSAMKLVKSSLPNSMSDQWLSDSLVIYIERDVFACIDNEIVMRRFQNMKTRCERL